MIRFACPHCDHIHDRRDAEAGTKFPCEVCTRRLQVPWPPRADEPRAAPTEDFDLPIEPDPPPPPRQWTVLFAVLGVGMLLLTACGVLIALMIHTSNRAVAKAEPTTAAPAPKPVPPRPTPPVPKPIPLTPTSKETKKAAPTGKATATNPVRPAPPPPPPPPPPDLAQQAHNVLRTHCYRCHGENGTDDGGLSFILDRERLVNRRKVVPRDPDRSRLLARVADREMPPPKEGEPLGKTEIAVLHNWIQAGAPSWAAPRPDPGFTPDDQLIKLVHADIQKAPKPDRPFLRYFTLAHLANAGLSDAELETHRRALAKLVNSLSWHQEIVKPEPVDPARALLRIDLRDYGWQDGAWQLVLDRYPYAVLHNSDAADFCFREAGGQLPYVRADWFVAEASRPPLYYDVLKLPEHESGLLRKFRLDRSKNVEQNQVVRIGFNASGIAQNNRLLERHELRDGELANGSYYWRSYDVGDAGERRNNLFKNPLGGEAGREGFQADGGEIIFSLPNGLHAFMLTDGRGKRIDKAPTEIVRDPKRPDGVVLNGVSCMSCHVQGLIPKADQIRPHVEKNRAAFAGTADRILALYPPEARLKSQFDQDNAHFRRALERTGCRLTEAEPVGAVVRHHEGELDLRVAAAELGLRPKELEEGLGKHDALSRALPLRVEEGTVTRKVFTREFADLVIKLKRGRYLPRGINPPPR